MDDPEHQVQDLPATHAPVPDSPAAVFWRNRATGLFDRLPLPAAFCRADGTILRANPALAAERGVLAGSLRGRSALGLFHPETRGQLRSITEAIRLHRRSRYLIDVRWTTAKGSERHGEASVDLVGDVFRDEPNLLIMVREAAEARVPEALKATSHVLATADGVETRILALTAGGWTTARIASAVGLTPDGVNYHLRQLSQRWGVSGRPALVARAFVEGVLDPDAWPPAPAPAPAPASARESSAADSPHDRRKVPPGGTT
ncbi:PAS domain S-box protein [Streptomyces sp. NPDC048277]|uniref:helix-turn-helix transcriptional regulator n=1 Tax=Streptomyces sp. NPDC048277 TaxID=3155027 RepID=UPI0033F3A4FF